MKKNKFGLSIDKRIAPGYLPFGSFVLPIAVIWLFLDRFGVGPFGMGVFWTLSIIALVMKVVIHAFCTEWVAPSEVEDDE